MSSLRERILSAPDRTMQPIMAIPEWGIAPGELFLRTLSGNERETFERWIKKNPGSDLHGLLKLLSVTLVDAHGEPVFTDEDLGALRDRNSATLMRLLEQAKQLNDLKPEDIEDLRKNSKAGRNGALRSDSPATLEKQSSSS